MTIGDETDERPLAGVTVADFTQMLAGPSATMALADLGATVVKLEQVGAGDHTRTVGLEGVMFYVANRNKRSIAIDLKSPQGHEIAHRLATRSDVVVDSFRSGVMDRLGLGFEALAKLNPKLICASLTGFGSAGPDRDRRGVDLVLQAESGLMALTGEPDGPPTKAGFQLIDEGAGLALAQAILAALFRRERTGRGAHIEVRLLDVALFVQAMQIAEYSLTKQQPPRRGNSVGHAAPSDLVSASDGGIMIASYFDGDWTALCRLLDLEWMTIDPRFSSVSARITHRAEMLDLLNERFARRTRAEWFEALTSVGVMVGIVKEYEDVVKSPQITANGSLFEAEVGLSSPITMVALPYWIDGAPVSTVVMPPPALGAHTIEVLGELGYTSSEIDKFLANGAVRADRPNTSEVIK